MSDDKSGVCGHVRIKWERYYYGMFNELKKK